MTCICYKRLFIKTVCLTAFILTGQGAYGACTTDRDAMYKVFKSYRQHLNTVKHIDELKPYFSISFNEYYLAKLAKLQNKPGYDRFFTQYWDNLNTARDIVIVFDYTARCVGNSPALELIAVLDTTSNDRDIRNGTDSTLVNSTVENSTVENSTVELWRVRVYFEYEQSGWKIDSFEYRKNGAARQYLATDIIDNFVLIR